MDVIAVEEWMGKPVRIVSASNPAHIGLEGEVVDETRDTLVLLGPDGRKRRVPKKGSRIRFLDQQPPKTLSGDELAVRPEERSKRLHKKVR